MDNMDKTLLQFESKINNQNKRINYLIEEFSKKEDVNSIVPLIRTSIGRCTSDGKITYRNWWGRSADGFWFSHFLKNKFPDVDYDINMFSVFGDHDNITENMVGKKVLFSGENLNKNTIVTHFNENFGRFALDYVDLAMSYDLLDHPKYFRFPLWIIWHFSPGMSKEDIKIQIEEWNSLDYEKSKNVALVASHDRWKSRTLISSDVEMFTSIDYAGAWRKNTSELHELFGNNKEEYLKQFKFNICPENVLDDGYVTEKIFDAIKCDCIPLYAGGGNYLEPKVINRKTVLIWDFEKDNSDTIELFKNLLFDEKSYIDFKEQNRLLEDSYKYIWNKYKELEKRFEQLIYD